MSAGCHHHHHTEKALSVTLAINVLLTALKWTAFVFTRSSSLFAEAVHSTFDTMNPLVLWLGYSRSRRPRCEQHPQGHSREAFFWSLMAAIMMLTFGAGFTAYRGVQALVFGYVPEMHWWAAAIMAVALVGEGISLLLSRRALKGDDIHRTKNTTALALVFENSVDMLGVTLALAGYGLFLLTGQAVWDAIFSLAIACLLAGSSVFLIRRNLSLITGETASEDVCAAAEDIVRRTPGVMRVARLVVTMSGPEEMRCSVSVVLDAPGLADEFRTKAYEQTTDEAVYWTMIRVARTRNDIKERLLAGVPGLVSVNVECS